MKSGNIIIVILILISDLIIDQNTKLFIKSNY